MYSGTQAPPSLILIFLLRGVEPLDEDGCDVKVFLFDGNLGIVGSLVKVLHIRTAKHTLNARSVRVVRCEAHGTRARGPSVALAPPCEA
eukprot:10822357-Alexandrium_andersonii.AAC.1